jgi:hypothetical protein
MSNYQNKNMPELIPIMLSELFCNVDTHFAGLHVHVNVRIFQGLSKFRFGGPYRDLTVGEDGWNSPREKKTTIVNCKKK